MSSRDGASRGQTGPHLRELIRVRDQAKLWPRRTTATVRHLALQSDIARRVTGALALELLPSEETRWPGANRRP